jgi:chemotaxis family two-component system response regulator PixG
VIKPYVIPEVSNLVKADSSMIEKLFSDLMVIQERQATGQLRIKPHKDSQANWRVYFHDGKIVWATGGQHAVRRWHRIAKQYEPSLLNLETLTETGQIEGHGGKDFNEYQQGQLLAQAIQNNTLLLNKAKMLLQDFWNEVFFNVVNLKELHAEWIPLVIVPQQAVWLYVDSTVKRSQKLADQWHQDVSNHLEKLPQRFSPDLAPIVTNPEKLRQKVSSTAFEALSKKLNGQVTFWEMAAQMQQPLTSVVGSLLPLMLMDIIQLREIPDFPAPKRKAQPQSVHSGRMSSDREKSSEETATGVIACIDDSPVISKTLEAILSPLGYKVFSIVDPLQGFSQLLERKPDLIFLDLLMPNTNGYEVCSFLRKSAVFKETPIVMLTGQDGVVDRLRARVVGSTEFLSKPPDAEKVIQVVQRLLDNTPPKVAALRQKLGEILTYEIL